MPVGVGETNLLLWFLSDASYTTVLIDSNNNNNMRISKLDKHFSDLKLS